MINYSLAMRGNPTDIEQPKKAYASAQAKEVMDINAFAAHLVDHGCVYSKGDIVGILTMAISCIKEQLLNGNSVKLGDFGKFWISLTSKGAKDFESYNTNSHIRKVTAKWTPGPDLKNLLQEAEFNRVLSKKDAAAAKKEVYGK